VKQQVSYYHWWSHGLFDNIFSAFGWRTFGEGGVAVADSFTGATPLGLAKAGGWAAVTEVYTPSQMWWGGLPGSIGETCKPFIIVGAAALVAMKVASWRVMIGMVIGCALTGMLMNGFTSGSSTNRGKWIYGFFIGAVGLIIRVMNPAYPEGWMLAILFMNVFAPLIDHYVLESNISKRLKRA